MPRPTKKPKQRETLAQVIRRATARELAKRQDEADRSTHTFHQGKINGWTAEDLASWISPGVLRSIASWMRTLRD